MKSSPIQLAEPTNQAQQAGSERTAMNLVHLVCLASLLPMQAENVARAAAPPQIARFLELCDTTRRGAILQLEHELRKEQNAPSAERSPVRIARLESHLRQLQARHELTVPTHSFPPQPGAIGRLPGDSCYVEQVISDDEVLIRCHFRVPVTTVRNFRAYRDVVAQPVVAVVRGWKQSVAEGQDATTNDIFEVVGRENYSTQGGAVRTVLVLRPFDTARLEPYLNAPARTRAAKPVATETSGG